MEKLTEWYPGHIKPVRVGVYQRLYGRVVVGFAYWNGRNWHQGEGHITGALSWVKYPTPGLPDLMWRGLAQDPEAAHD